MVLLFTGFEPFGGHRVNPTHLLVQHFDKMVYDGLEIIGKVIPLRFHEIRPLIRNLIDDIQPDYIVMSGQAPRNAITPERIAINYAETSTPYNCGTTIEGQFLDSEGEDGFFSTLPLKRIVQGLREKGIPCSISLSAGTYGCNQIFYECMRYLRIKHLDIPAGFIHVPLLPEQALNGRYASMSFELMIKAFETIFRIIDKSHEKSL
ncbi:MAG: pyroglutamyl-peptidase I [Methanobacteriota archaeon]|nr:MAG: pyroglutamyl-peptidase I [Euryarchaeota archaeon]